MSKNPEESDTTPQAVFEQAGLAETPTKPERRKRIGLGKRIGQLAATGSVSLVALGAWQHFNQSGQYEQFSPTRPNNVQIDNDINIGSWNMHGQARTRWRQILKIINKNHLDAMALQEVTADDAASLSKHLPAFHIVYVEADLKQHILDGGYGDALITGQKPTDIESKSFAGTSLVKSIIGTTEGLGQDIASGDTDFHYTKQGMQENRAALAETIRAETDGKFEDVRIETSHISGNEPEHGEQFPKLLDFIQGNNTGNRLAVFCGDMNAPNEQAIPALNNIRMTTQATRPTSVDGGDAIDHCAYYSNGRPILGQVRVLNSPTTDHHPIILSLSLNP